MINAVIRADSINEFDTRLTTMVLTFPRYILAEFNTHRALSKNSASSRAIPFNKPKRPTDMVRQILNNPFVPSAWMKEHDGMQGTEYFSPDEVVQNNLVEDWLGSRTVFLEMAKTFNRKGLTKQLVNRLVEPFLWHTVIVTGSEWENFFALRHHSAADIHIQELAQKMMDVYNESTPNKLKAGEWHIPFGDNLEDDRIVKELIPDLGAVAYSIDSPEARPYIDFEKVRISTARCARVSYLNFEGKDDYLADIKLYEALRASGHMSPFEHCARAMNFDEWKSWTVTYPYSSSLEDLEKQNRGLQYLEGGVLVEPGWCGNFRGFVQLRKTFQNENRKDNRVIKKVYEELP